MASNHLPTPDVMRQLLDYCPDTGRLSWRARPPEIFKTGRYTSERACKIWNTRYAGTPALAAVDKVGYHFGSVFAYPCKAHRAAWCIYHGRWPDGDIDHINGDPADNRIANLRDVSHAENMRNMKMPVTNKSGEVGIHKDPTANSYVVRIGKKLHVGRWQTMEEAKAARHAAMKVLNYHENHGRA